MKTIKTVEAYVDLDGNWKMVGDVDLRDFSRRVLAGRHIRMKIGVALEGSSIESNRGFYFGIIVVEYLRALVELGWNYHENNLGHRAQVHDFIKKYVLKNGYVEERRESGVRVVVRPSTRRLDEEGWERFIDDCRMWAAENINWEIPQKKKGHWFPAEEHEPEGRRYR